MNNERSPAILVGACVALLVATPASFGQSTPSETLGAFVEAVLAQHPDVQSVSARVRRAHAEANAASRPLYNPELELEYEDAEEAEKTLAISQAIDWGGKRSARARVGTATASAVSAEAETAHEAFAGRTLSALARHGTQSRLAELAERRLALMLRFQSIARQRHNEGDLPRVDLDLAVLAATQAKFERARSSADLAAAREEVLALTPTNWTKVPGLPDALPTPASATSAPAELPAIRAARLRVEASEAQLDLARRERRPDPVLAARAGKEGDADLLGLSFSIPLFVRNTFSDEVIAADAELAAASADLASLIRNREARLARAHARFREMKAAWDEWQASGEISLDRQIETLERLWSAGEIATSDYLLQITQALETRSSATELRGELWEAWIDWLVASATTLDWLGIAP